jgi:hypothetical protein
MKKILMDLHPCFTGYSGIPHDTRITLSLLAQSGKITAGGHLLGRHYGTTGFPWDEKAPHHEKINLMSKYLIALKENVRRYDWATAKSAILRKYLKSRKDEKGFAKAWKRLVNNGIKRPSPEIFELDAAFFADYIWREMLEHSVDLKHKDEVLGISYFGGSVSKGLMRHYLDHDLKPAYTNTSSWDFYLSQTPFPGAVSKNTQLMVRFHDAVPIQFPTTIHDPYKHNTEVYKALKSNVHRDSYFVCNSETTRKQLLRIFPELEDRSSVVYCCVPSSFENIESPGVLNIILNRVNYSILKVKDYEQRQKYRDFVREQFNEEYFLVVSTVEPRKNYGSILNAWKNYRKQSRKDIKLVVVGNWGWGSEKMMPVFNAHAQDGNLFYVSDLPWEELIELYSNAYATITASYFEGFSFSGIESMRCRTPVIASNIETHMEVYGDHAFYFDPYSVKSLTRAMLEMMATPKEELESIKIQAYEHSLKYSEKNCGQAWENLLNSF